LKSATRQEDLQGCGLDFGALMDSGLLDTPASPRPTAGPVRVWLLQSKYGGDNAQVLGIGEHLARQFGWSCETRQVRFHPARKEVREEIPQSIDFARSDSLAPPFPDVVISCSRFYGMVGAWLKRQSDRPMVHVHFGRIAAPTSSFDLLAATAQYGLPAVPNFMPLTLPFVSQNPARAKAAVAAWAPQFQELPRPWTVLLVGGPVPLVRFDKAAEIRIAAQAIARVRAEGGALIVVMSRRTPGSVGGHIAARIRKSRIPFRSVCWPAPEPNPYPAVLALGDRFLVTCDSPSMIADACLTGKPTELIHLPVTDFVTRFSSRGLGFSIDVRRRRRKRNGKRPDALDRLRDLLVARYWMRPWDDVRDFLHGIDRRQLLVPDAGRIARQIQDEELDAMAARIAALVVAKSIAPSVHSAPNLVPAAVA
jgi:mitochondrial fission protein ELM1